MSTPRGLANHHLYLARLVLGAWARERAAEDVPAATLAEAFGPGCHDHLVRAYGWFLLAVASPDAIPDTAPARVADLPPLPAGKAVSGEIREFEQLEREGWLADMLAWQPQRPGQATRAVGNLARSTPDTGGHGRFEGWVDALDRQFQRMSDSLDEY